MAKDIEVEIFLKGGKQFEKDVKRTGKAADKAADGFSKGQKSLISFAAAFSIVSQAARIASRVVSTLINIGSAAVKTGSDFEEAAQKFGVVFAGVAEESRVLRDELARNFGLSRLAATELLSATGDLLTGFGFTDKAALDLSESVNRLAVDLASFSNVQGGAARVSRIITKSLLGEREGLKELGIAILESEVNARVLEKGQQDLTGEALKQARAIATLDLAYRQSGKAVDDFTRTSASLANQQRILTARFEDLETSLGQILVPITKIYVSNLVDIITATVDWVEANKDIIASGIVDFAKLLAASFTFVVDSSLLVIRTFVSLKGAAQLLAKGFIDLVTIGVDAFATLVEATGDLAEVLVQGFKDPLNTIKRLFFEFAETVNEIIISADAILPQFVVDNVKENLAIIKQSIADSTTGETGETELSKNIKQTSKNIKESADFLRDRSKAAQADAIATLEQIEGIESLRKSLKDLNNDIQDGLNAIGSAADAGTLFDDTLENIKKQSEAEKKAAADRAALIAAEREEERVAVAEFNAFLSATEDAQLEQVDVRRKRRLEGLELEIEQNIELAKQEKELIAEINEAAAEEEFLIREDFRKKDKTARELRDLQILQEKRRQSDLELKVTANLLGGLAALSASEGEKNFKTTKALRIGEAVINTYAGAARALADIAYPLNLVAAASVIATGLAQVNTIRQQNPVRAQHGIDIVQRAEQPALLHFGETVLTRDETSLLADFLQERNVGDAAPGTSTGTNGINVTIMVENLSLMTDDEEAIGKFTTAIRRQLEEQNLVAIQ